MTRELIDTLLREPRLMTRGRQPIGPVAIDRSHPVGAACRAFFLGAKGMAQVLIPTPYALGTGTFQLVTE